MTFLGFIIWVFAFYLAYRLFNYANAKYRKEYGGQDNLIAWVLVVVGGLVGLWLIASSLQVMLGFALFDH